ncbi:MAG: survival protein SurE [Acidimicrobiia bacterium]|nr:survival protein SurE [Acidimicrobiia bacterium]
MKVAPRLVAVALATVLSTAIIAPAGAGPVAVPTAPLRILVTNDDGVSADGIDALVQGLLGVADVEVTVIAPLEDMSGTGTQTTGGTLTAISTTTKSGYPALAIDGFPADTVKYAVSHLDQLPQLVMSGINAGSNLGPIVYGSGTVGAVQEARKRGVPGVALSQGDEGVPANYPAGVEAALVWLDEHLDALVARERGDPLVIESVNIPTCIAGEIRGTLRTKIAKVVIRDDTSDCTSTKAVKKHDDNTAFLLGYITVSALPKPKRR